MLNSLVSGFYVFLFSCAIFLCFPPVFIVAAELTDSFSFEVEEFEKEPLVIGGYIETKWEHIDINQQGALAKLKNYDDPVSTVDTFTESIQLDGSYIKGISSVNWLLKASGQWADDDGWVDTADIFEAYLSLKPNNNLTTSFGKKNYKWGKGYAWNPVGFLNRRKDPNNPEEALEGYITAEADIIKSLSGNLQNVALTTVILPVYTGLNDDFGQEKNIDLAAKLYLLYEDTDLDFLFYTGNSRSTRFGFDFSRNLATNFEIHGEYAYFPNYKKIYLQEDGSTISKKESDHSLLLGLRYLSDFNLTSIIEYYHNGTGYSQDELSTFNQMVADGYLLFTEQGEDNLLRAARKLGLQGYSLPYLGTDYLYGRFTLKEPWDILYFTPAMTAIMNLNDQSFNLTPEVLYTGFTNWELRLRFSLLAGSSGSEYGEKINSNKVELRARRFF